MEGERENVVRNRKKECECAAMRKESVIAIVKVNTRWTEHRAGKSKVAGSNP